MKQLTFVRRVLQMLAISILALPVFSSRAFSLDLKPEEIRGKSSKNPVSVLQNRYFLKALRPEFGFVVGSLLNEAYTSTRLTGVRAGLFFNEWFGIETQMISTVITDTADRKALNNLKYRPLDDPGNAVPAGEEIVVSPDPEINAVHGITDIHGVIAPFYGKLNLMNKMIVYTDLYLSGGMATVDTDQGSKSALTLGIGERFYVGKAWSFRVDVTDRTYTEIRAGQESRKNGFSVDFGASYFFR